MVKVVRTTKFTVLSVVLSSYIYTQKFSPRTDGRVFFLENVRLVTLVG